MSREAPVIDGWFVGEDQTFRFTIYQADGVTPQNISGWSLEWVLRVRASSSSAILTKTTSSGIVITDESAGKCEVSVTRTESNLLVPGKYFHTLRRSDTNFSTVLSHGDAVLRYAATR